MKETMEASVGLGASSKANKEPRCSNYLPINGDPIQAKFYPPEDQDKANKEWNALLDHIEFLHKNHDLGNKQDIDRYVEQAESEWYGDGDHSPSVNQFNAFITLKDKIKQGLEDKKKNIQDSTSLGWDDIVNYLEITINAHGFIRITSQSGNLTGGHGKGVTWSATQNNTVIHQGSIPGNTHGRNDGALGGARATVRQVINAHNLAIDNAIAHVDQM